MNSTFSVRTILRHGREAYSHDGLDILLALAFGHPAIALFTTALVVFWARKIYSSSVRKYPPGPRGLPFVGNVFQLEEKSWVVFNRWKEQYGPIVYLTMFGQPVIVLNTYEVAADLLDRRGDIYSDRARNIVACDFLTGGDGMAWMAYSSLWRRMHRAAHEALNKNAVGLFHTIQSTEAVIWTRDLIGDPERWQKHTRRLGASIISSAAYGLPSLKSSDDPAIALVNEHTERMSIAAYPFTYAVDFIPVLRYLPSWIAKWKRDAQYWYEKDSLMHETMCGDAKKRSAMKDERTTLVDAISASQKRFELSDRQAAWLVSQFYAAGAETTTSALEWFILAMVLHPDVQAKAQAEIDSVIGQSRMPLFVDFDELHYVRAVEREVLRWGLLGATGIPHRSTQDDWYKGYFIPKGTVCVPNVVGMNKDPGVWGPDAEDFKPQRYLDETTGRLTHAPADTKDEGHTVFGFGRSSHGFVYLSGFVQDGTSQITLFITIANILWAAKIAPATDENGNVIIPKASDVVMAGLATQPAPFNCSITPRFPHTEAIVTQTLELADQ